jgi:hypothetical protein
MHVFYAFELEAALFIKLGRRYEDKIRTSLFLPY